MKKGGSWQFIEPIVEPPKKLGVIIAFDIETRQLDVNKKISTYTVKQKSELMFGTACAYVHASLLKPGQVEPIKSKLGFQEQIEDYFLVDELYFEDKERFTRWVLKFSKYYKRVYVYAHNTSFDIRESVSFPLLRKAGFEISVFNPQPKQFIVNFERKQEKGKRKWRIIFTDTLNLYPSSLEEIGKLLGVEKLEKELGLDRANLEDAIKEGKWHLVLKYNVRDTQITAMAVIIREKIVNELGGQLRLTNPSTALDLFRRRFLKTKIKKPGKRIRDFIRRSYFGGKTEVFFRGVITTPEYRGSAMNLYNMKKEKYGEYGFLEVPSIHYLDVNSLFPYSMKYFPSPIKELSQYGPEGKRVVKMLHDLGILIEFDPLNPLESIYQAWKRQLRWLKNEKPDVDWDWVEEQLEKRRNDDSLLELKDFFAKPVLYIVEATVHVKKKHILDTVTPLPLKKDGKLVFPQGTFSGVWTQFELSIINPPQHTDILQIHKILLFEGDWIFIEYIDTFYNLKSEAKKKGDTISYQVAKLFMNSLYGKWAEKKRVSVVMSREEMANYIMEQLKNKPVNTAIEIAYDTDYGTLRIDNKTINCVGGYYELKLDDYMEPYSVSIATFVTSVARSVLRAYMYRVKENGGLVFYTDSVSGDTEVIIRENGKIKFIPIRELFKEKHLVVGEKEYSFIANIEALTLKNGKLVWKPIKYVMRHKTNKKMYRIWLTNYWYIDVTEDHSLMGWLSGSKFNRKPVNERIVEVKPQELGKKVKSLITLNGELTSKSSNVNTKFWELVGLLVGDGHWGGDSSSAKYYLGLATGKGTQEIIKKVLEPLKGTRVVHNFYVRNEKGDITILSKELASFMIKFFKKDGIKDIPDFMFNLPKEAISAFLRGLFTADGTVIMRDGRPIVRFTNTNDRIIEKTRKLLWIIGIGNSVFIETKPNSYNGKVSQTYSKHIIVKDRHSFKEKVGFILDRKNWRLSFLPELKLKYLGDIDFLLQNFIKVEEIEYDDYVYDIEVEETHTFFANGILVHNTDSLIVDSFGYEALLPYIDKYRLGYLDEELENIAFIEINTLKDYKVFIPVEITGEIVTEKPIGYLKLVTIREGSKEKNYYLYDDDGITFWVKYKLKGVPLKKAQALTTDDDRVFKVERLVGVREFLKYNEFGLYWIEQEKELKRVYDKAARADGWVEPYYL